MCHYKLFCHAWNRPFSKQLTPFEHKDAKLYVQAVAAKTWCRDGSTWSPPSRVRKQIDKSRLTLMACY